MNLSEIDYKLIAKSKYYYHLPLTSEALTPIMLRRKINQKTFRKILNPLRKELTNLGFSLISPQKDIYLKLIKPHHELWVTQADSYNLNNYLDFSVVYPEFTQTCFDEIVDLLYPRMPWAYVEVVETYGLEIFH